MKNYIWSELVKAVTHELVMTQSQLADECSVTQQTISNWKTGARKPGLYAQSRLLELVEQAGISHYDFLLDPGVSEMQIVEQLKSCMRGLDEEHKKVVLRVVFTLSESLRQQQDQE